MDIKAAMERISSENGVLVIVTKEEDPEIVISKIQNLALENKETPVVNSQSRQVGLGSQILSDLGIRKMRLLSSSSQLYHSLSGFGLEIVEYVCD